MATIATQPTLSLTTLLNDPEFIAGMQYSQEVIEEDELEEELAEWNESDIVSYVSGELSEHVYYNSEQWSRLLDQKYGCPHEQHSYLYSVGYVLGRIERILQAQQ